MTSADCKMADGFGGLVVGTCTAAEVCDYDACTTDATCPDATNVCICQGQTPGDGKFGSVCIQANCHVDTDCGPSGFCSPSITSCGGTTGYYCHVCADTCVNDSDCPTDPTLGPYPECAYDATVGHWACTYALCSG